MTLSLEESLRRQLFDRFPLHVHLGLELVETDGTFEVVLPAAEHTTNSFGSQAAASLFAAADAASGVALVAALAEQLDTVDAVVFSSELRFLRPAVGRILARGFVDAQPAELLEALEREAKTRAAVRALLSDDTARTVCEVTVNWQLRRPGPVSLWRRAG